MYTYILRLLTAVAVLASAQFSYAQAQSNFYYVNDKGELVKVDPSAAQPSGLNVNAQFSTNPNFVFTSDMLQKTEGEEHIIKDLGQDTENDHVIQFLQGEYLITLLPVEDFYFNNQRLESYLTSVKLGKLALKDWLIRSAKVKGLLNTEAEEALFLSTLEKLEDKTDKEIEQLIEKADLPSMPSYSDIVRNAKKIEDVKRQLDDKNKAIEALAKTIREIDEKHETINLSDGREYTWKERLFPSALIIQAGIKIPPGWLKAPTEQVGPAFVGNSITWTLSLLTKIVSDSSATITVLNRPWKKHVRNLNTNEVVMSTDDPKTWYWEQSLQLWGAKNAGSKPNLADKFTFPRIRTGIGALWSKDMRNLTELKGIFSGVSMNIKNSMRLPLLSPVSTNVKFGIVYPYENFKMSNLSDIVDHFYVMAGFNFGVPMETRFSRNFNYGVIFNLTEVVGMPTLPVGPPTKPPGVVIGGPGQPPSLPSIPGSGTLNPVKP